MLDLVAARVSAGQLRKIMNKQQCRAYSRAAGYHAARELLQACTGLPRLQCKLLSELVQVLKPPTDALASSWQLVTHYSRDIQCAGVHAWGRLHLAFAALVEHLVRLLDVRSPPSATHAARPSQAASSSFLGRGSVSATPSFASAAPRRPTRLSSSPPRSDGCHWPCARTSATMARREWYRSYSF